MTAKIQILGMHFKKMGLYWKILLLNNNRTRDFEECEEQAHLHIIKKFKAMSSIVLILEPVNK